MNPSKIRQRLSLRLKEEFLLGKALIRFRGPFVMGWLDLRYTECRKGQCKCTRGRPHGPFLYANLRRNGKKFYKYVGKPEDAGLVQRVKHYQEFRDKLGRFRKLYRIMETDWRQLEQSLTIRSSR